MKRFLKTVIVGDSDGHGTSNGRFSENFNARLINFFALKSAENSLQVYCVKSICQIPTHTQIRFCQTDGPESQKK